MPRKHSLLIAAVSIVIMSAAFAKPPEIKDTDTFVGLWEGVWAPAMTTGGYGAIRSITVNNDDTYTIYGDWSDNDTCIFIGTGVIEDDVLVVDDMTRKCADDTVNMPTSYTFDETNGVLREELYHSTTGETFHNILHKTSQ